MVLIDSVYVNNSSGLILLSYLIEKIKKNKMDLFFLFDKRTEEFFRKDENLINKIFISNSYFERKNFYKKHKNDFSHILCFGNVPPPIKMNSKVFVYFHQRLFLNIPDNFSLKMKVVYKIKQLIINYYKSNTNYWLVQTKSIQISLAEKYYKGSLNNIKILPFYPPINFESFSVKRLNNSFLYVSSSFTHKNHEQLIYAFCEAYEHLKEGSLCLTVPDSDIQLCNLIIEKNRQGYPIKNIGFIPREQLAKIYLSHEYLIFPSLSESLGLGLLEAIDGGCKIIASHLPYTFEVCEPSLTFDPLERDSIKNAIITAVSEKLPISKKLVSNDINQLFLLLTE